MNTKTNGSTKWAILAITSLNVAMIGFVASAILDIRQNLSHMEEVHMDKLSQLNLDHVERLHDMEMIMSHFYIEVETEQNQK